MGQLKDYAQKKYGSADEYWEIKGKEVRLAISKANDLYYTIGEARMELKYVNKEYYIRDNEEIDEFGIDFVRYIHLKNAIQDLNRIYDIALQIPWFLYRIWEEKSIFNTQKKTKDKQKANKISRKNDAWVSDAEELCKYSYVKEYFKRNSTDDGEDLLKLLDEFNKKFLINKDKPFTIRTLCNYIKHKGNIQPVELQEKINLSLKVNSEMVQSNIIELPVNCLNISNLETIPVVEINRAENLIIDIKYNKNKEDSINNFWGKDILKKKYTLDDVYKECIDYLIEFKPIYDKYLDILNTYVVRIFIEPKKINNATINLNRLYQKK